MKILFVNPFGIGDALFTTPLIRQVTMEGHSVYYWCNERVADILKHNSAVKGIFACSRGDLKKIFKASKTAAIKKALALIKWLKDNRFDAALDFSLDYRYSLFLRLMAVKKIIGFDYKNRGFFLTDKVMIKGFSDTHIVKHYAGLLKFIGVKTDFPPAMELAVGRDDEIWADALLGRRAINKEDVLIAIVPGGGASWGAAAFIKQWRKENFAYVADSLASQHSCRILLLGTENERALCSYINDKIKGRALDACGITTPGQFAALLKRCRLLLTNDGGPLHMAVALGLSTVSLFGPVDERVYGPYPASSRHAVITAETSCRPCYKSFKYPMCRDRVCLDTLEPHVVLNAVKEKLNEERAKTIS